MIPIPSEYKSYVNSVKRKCKYHGVNLVLSPSRNVILTDDYKNECSGYFDGETKLFVVACGKPAEEWMQVFVHEACHMDQWIQKDPRLGAWGNACAAMWEFLQGKRLLNKAQLRKVEDLIMQSELDCEMRSVEKIKEWGLPIPLEKYIKGANAYVFSYRLMGTYMKFPMGIMKDTALLEASPKVFLKSYQQIPTKLAKELNRFFKDQKDPE